MKLKRGENRYIRTAFSAVFVVQLLVSSFCFITPASAVEPALSGHCHERMQPMHGDMPMQSTSHHGAGTACTHCDSPQNLNTVTYAADLTPAAVPLAFVAPYAEVPSPVAAENFVLARAQAPPDSSGLLLTTTLRIRI